VSRTMKPSHPVDGRSREQTALTRHEAAVVQSLAWADEAAAARDYAGAGEWLAAIQATGYRLSDEHLGKQVSWARAARVRPDMRPASARR